jgi:hypothetical protein
MAGDFTGRASNPVAEELHSGELHRTRVRISWAMPVQAQRALARPPHTHLTTAHVRCGLMRPLYRARNEV